MPLHTGSYTSLLCSKKNRLSGYVALKHKPSSQRIDLKNKNRGLVFVLYNVDMLEQHAISSSGEDA